MTRPFTTNIANTAQKALGFMMEPLSYSQVVTYSAKVATTAGATSTTISFNTLATGLTTLAPGDKFTVSPSSTTYTVSNTTTAAGGVLSGVTFSPGLSIQATAGAAVTVTKNVSLTVSALAQGINASLVPNTLVQATDVTVLVDTSTLPGKPSLSDTITLASGRKVTVYGYSTDAAGAFHTLMAR